MQPNSTISPINWNTETNSLDELTSSGTNFPSIANPLQPQDPQINLRSLFSLFQTKFSEIQNQLSQVVQKVDQQGQKLNELSRRMDLLDKSALSKPHALSDMALNLSFVPSQSLPIGRLEPATFSNTDNGAIATAAKTSTSVENQFFNPTGYPSTEEFLNLSPIEDQNSNSLQVTQVADTPHSSSSSCSSSKKRSREELVNSVTSDSDSIRISSTPNSSGNLDPQASESPSIGISQLATISNTADARIESNNGALPVTQNRSVTAAIVNKIINAHLKPTQIESPKKHKTTPNSVEQTETSSPAVPSTPTTVNSYPSIPSSPMPHVPFEQSLTPHEKALYDFFINYSGKYFTNEAIIYYFFTKYDINFQFLSNELRDHWTNEFRNLLIKLSRFHTIDTRNPLQMKSFISRTFNKTNRNEIEPCLKRLKVKFAGCKEILDRLEKTRTYYGY